MRQPCTEGEGRNNLPVYWGPPGTDLADEDPADLDIQLCQRGHSSSEKYYILPGPSGTRDSDATMMISRQEESKTGLVHSLALALLLPTSRDCLSSELAGGCSFLEGDQSP